MSGIHETSIQEQSRVLGDPTRHAVFRYVADAARPVGIAELTEHFELNHNTIRQHLAKLAGVGLVVATTAPASGRGRPRLVYVVDPSAESRWGVVGPYERLASWLAEVVRTGETAVEVGRRVGRALPLTEDADPIEQMADQMARTGYDPVVRRRGDVADITLQSCPFETTALAAPEVVCDLHLGVAQGIADNIEGLEVDELVRKDPSRARCRLRCHLEPAS